MHLDFRTERSETSRVRASPCSSLKTRMARLFFSFQAAATGMLSLRKRDMKARAGSTVKAQLSMYCFIDCLIKDGRVGPKRRYKMHNEPCE